MTDPARLRELLAPMFGRVACDGSTCMTELDRAAALLATATDEAAAAAVVATREACAYQCRLMSQAERICVEPSDGRNWSDHCRDVVLGIEISPRAAAVARVVEAAIVETQAERAPAGAAPKSDVVWDCSQHRRMAVDDYLALDAVGPAEGPR